MYASGIPMGIITDRKSPRLAAIIGMLALLVGYYPIKLAYDRGPGGMSVAWISFFSFLSGVGSCAAFQGALKTATLNWPTHRGSATACPLAAFGLSAFFYTVIAGLAFPGDTSSLLMLLSLATSLLVLVSIPFLNVVDHQKGTTYTVLPTSDRGRRDSNLLHRTRTGETKHQQTTTTQTSKLFFPAISIPIPITCQPRLAVEDEISGPSTEDSSLLSDPGDIIDNDDATGKKSAHSHPVDVTGLALLPRPDFWQLFLLMGLLSGVGLMTIK
jgi:hypothetical protein